MAVLLKLLIVLEAILEVVVEALEIRCLSFLIWVFLYCRNMFFLLLKMVSFKFLKFSSLCLCCRNVLVLVILSMEVVDLDIVTLDSIVGETTFSFPYYGLLKLISFPFVLQGFWCYFIG